MIKYKLICKDCRNLFDSWFASSVEFEKLKKLKHIDCHVCNSFNIEKSLMTPNILNSKSEKLKILENKKYVRVKNKIKKYQKFIKKNFKYVGDNFAHEARSIHYDNKKDNFKGIYGKASIKEVNDLKDEGIKTEIVPWIDEKNN
jgi:hypothetical protein